MPHVFHDVKLILSTSNLKPIGLCGFDAGKNNRNRAAMWRESKQVKEVHVSAMEEGEKRLLSSRGNQFGIFSTSRSHFLSLSGFIGRFAIYSSTSERMNKLSSRGTKKAAFYACLTSQSPFSAKGKNVILKRDKFYWFWTNCDIEPRGKWSMDGLANYRE